MKPITLILGDHRYDYLTLLRVAGNGPMIDVAEGEINDGNDPQFRVTTEPPSVDIPMPDRGEAFNRVVFFKQKGKMTLIVGEAGVALQKQDPKYKGVLRGRLVSSVMLKKARVVEPAAEVEETKAEPTYTPEFANRPRFGGQKQPRGPLGQHTDKRRWPNHHHSNTK